MKNANDQYSVLMSVYYKEKGKFLCEAINSIWAQTIPTDDFVLVCDGPLTPELDKVIEGMEKDHPELRVIRLEKNGGLGNALNIGIKQCKNELVARMDSDDISRPDRCERQLEMFKSHPEISICSGTIEEFTSSTDVIIGKRELPEHDEKIKVFSRKRNPFNHPAVMFRKTIIEAAGGYNESFHLFEDYYLWIRVFLKGAVGYNIREPILYMRTPEDMYIRRGGYSYTLNMLRFHVWLLSCGWTKVLDFIIGAIPHAVVCILPNKIRGTIYKILHN